MDIPRTMEGRESVIFKLSRLFVPVCDLGEDGRHVIAGNARVMRLPSEARISAAEDEGWLTYIVKGELAIRSADGVLEVVPSGSGRARRPLFSAFPHGLHAEARTSSVLLRFDRNVFRRLLMQQQRPRGPRDALSSQKLFSRVYAAWIDDALSLPDAFVEIHLLYGAGAPTNLRELARVLGDRTELGKAFLSATNRNRGGQPPSAQTKEAVLRLGFVEGRILALSLAAQHLHAVASVGFGRQVAERQFDHSLLIGVLAYLLARNKGMLDPYRALAAGLVHDLGALLVPAYLAGHPECDATHETCAIAMRRLRAVAGPTLLARYGFDANLAQAAEEAEHWHRNEAVIGDADLLVAAHFIAGQEDPSLPTPPPHRVPAFSRLCPNASRHETVKLLRHAFRLCGSIRRRMG